MDELLIEKDELIAMGLDLTHGYELGAVDVLGLCRSNNLSNRFRDPNLAHE